jgi:hypothetical protein
VCGAARGAGAKRGAAGDLVAAFGAAVGVGATRGAAEGVGGPHDAGGGTETARGAAEGTEDGGAPGKPAGKGMIDRGD